ncbi:MAG: OB-fold nucleic acid binding domain-containing protein [Candidatus Bathyarchaeota archaeon]|nr:OB-fold nucleic acid binding domain-containing protein [Candidatus Bathyarchaeota archaeon]
MTTQDIIEKILAKNPEISQEQILEKLKAEKSRTGGLLGDETLLRLIAAKYGVEVQQNTVHNNGNLSTSRLFAGLNDVTVAGRLIAVYPVRTFEGEKSGKFATLMVADNGGVLRVVLWNDKADLVEKGELKAEQAVRLLHGYTREDRYGRVELHLGVKSQIEIEPKEKASEYPTIDKFTTKIGSLSKTSGNVHLSGTVKTVLGVTSFTRSDSSDGTVMRFALADDSGEVTVVAWNEKAQELEKTLKANACLQLVNAKVKETQNGGLEAHVDSNTYVNVQAVALRLTKIANLTENQSVNVEGVVSTVPERKEVTTSKGETVKLTVFELKDDSGVVRVSAWRQHAEALNGLKIGDKLLLENAYVKKGFGDKMELSTRSGTVASIMRS